MVSLVDPGSKGLVRALAVFLGKTLYSHNASPPRSINGYWQTVLLVTSCYRNQDKLWKCGPLYSCADFTLPIQ